MAAPAAPSNGGIDITALLNGIGTLPAGLGKQAQAMAAQDVGATVAGIRGQQAQIVKDAAARASQQALLAQASARFLQGLNLGGAVAGDYRNAAADQRAAAAGYSGGLQQTVGDAAAKVQVNLAKTGSADTAHTAAPQAGNVLYGLGGNLPAEQLDVVGPTVASGLRALPASTLAYGQAQAQGALGAGQQQAGRLDPSIIAAQAKQSSIAAGYLGQLQKSALAAGQQKFADVLGVLKLQQAQTAQDALNAYRQAEIQTRHDAIAAANQRAAAGIAARKASATGGPGGKGALTQNEIIKLVPAWHDGKNTNVRVPVLNPDGTPKTNPLTGVPLYVTQTQTSGKLTYRQALKRLTSTGIPEDKALGYLNSAYRKGDSGRAWLTNDEQTTLRKTGHQATVGFYKGHAWIGPKQVAALQAAGQLPSGQMVNGRYFIAPGF